MEKCTVALSKTWERPDWAVLITVLGAAVLLLNYASVLEVRLMPLANLRK